MRKGKKIKNKKKYVYNLYFFISINYRFIKIVSLSGFESKSLTK